MKLHEYNQPYYGVSYPRLFDNGFAHWFWRRAFCPRNWHLFDECKSTDHVLHCDACGLMVHVAGVESSDAACARIAADEKPPAWLTIRRDMLPAEAVLSRKDVGCRTGTLYVRGERLVSAHAPESSGNPVALLRLEEIPEGR